jgi:hypothetical protein
MAEGVSLELPIFESFAACSNFVSTLVPHCDLRSFIIDVYNGGLFIMLSLVGGSTSICYLCIRLSLY